MDFKWVEWSNPVAIWWVFLVSVSVVNILSWFWTLIYYRSKKESTKDVSSKWRNALIALSAFYVFGCAFRSVLPRADVQRICLFDTWFSSVLIGRSVATVAELAFVAQWAIALFCFSEAAKIRWVGKLSLGVVPLIAVAECFSWYGVITTHYLGNSVEESIWAVTYSLIGLSLFGIWRKIEGPIRYALGVANVGCFVYVFFMVTVDVPMYLGRLHLDSQNGKPLLGFVSGIRDLNSRWIVNHQIHDWKMEIPWMSLYFCFAVWTSLALCYIPIGNKFKIKN